jgi:ribosomal protein S18 acetylase RimI-like enzyme
MQGFLVFDGDTPIAFCNANMKTAFTFDKNRARVCGDADSETVSIVCFIVAHDYRRKGIGSLLLRTAIESYTNKGIRRFEAYPSMNAKKDCEHYHGPVSLYLKHGFKIVEEYDGYLVMRRTDE